MPPSTRSRRWSWLLASVYALSFALSGLAVDPDAVAAHGGCYTNLDNRFLGMGRSDPQIIGVRAEIEYNNPHLCTQIPGDTKGSWSLSWVSVDGRDAPDGLNIFQGGYAKCPPPDVGSCPGNGGVPYYWWYYGHETGPCGMATSTGFVDVGDASTGAHLFKIVRETFEDGTYYTFRIDGLLKKALQSWKVSLCWNGEGVQAAEWQNEMLSGGDSPGGTPADRERWRDSAYRDSSGWHDINRTVGSGCDANSYPVYWRCEVVDQDGTDRSNTWRVWDVRD